MHANFPFEYTEYLPDRTRSRMPNKLEISGRNDPELLLILRLLSGSIKLEHKSSSKKITQKENYFSGDLRPYLQYWDTRFPKLIAEDYSAAQLSFFIESTKLKNRKFYKNILSELSYFFYYQNYSIHSTAFVFLYRTLEHVSYAFPLIYVSKTDDFSHTYTFLKELMSGDKDTGELGFFKIFVKKIFEGDPIYESSVDFRMELETESEQSRTFNLLEGLCKANMIADSTDRPRVLSIKYPEVGSFIIAIRNRFFHYMNGGARNIESSDIGDIELLFSLVNKKFLYWLSTILLEIVTHIAIDFENIKSRIP